MPGSPGDPSDLIDLDSQLSAGELALRASVRDFVDAEDKPNIADWFDHAYFPEELVPRLGKLGLLGMQLTGYGCAGRSAVEYGIAALELEAGDSGVRTFVSVQGSLAMTAIYRNGSDEQKQQWLPPLAAGETIGSFALTEPGAGSDPSSMTTFARRDGSDWVLNGAKRWIGFASIAAITIIWAQTEDGVRGFIVPTDAPGFRATPIVGKLSMRASIQCDLELVDVRLPAEAMLPGAVGLRAPFECLSEARYGIIWGSMGAARDSFLAALDYATSREQFGRPIAALQLTQEKLVNLVLELNKGMLLALHLGRLKDRGGLEPHQVSMGKLNNARSALAICREARTILGGNGVTLDYSPLRHANNLESVRTYEGTDEVHTLILGSHLTGHSAFN